MAGAAQSEEYILFRKALVEQRKLAGFSQAQLALMLRKPASFVGKYELGERRLDVVETWLILRCLNVKPGPFLDKVLVDLN